jgi:hypothetical protein
LSRTGQNLGQAEDFSGIKKIESTCFYDRQPQRFPSCRGGWTMGQLARLIPWLSSPLAWPGSLLDLAHPLARPIPWPGSPWHGSPLAWPGSSLGPLAWSPLGPAHPLARLLPWPGSFIPWPGSFIPWPGSSLGLAHPLACLFCWPSPSPAGRAHPCLLLAQPIPCRQSSPLPAAGLPPSFLLLREMPPPERGLLPRDTFS